MEVEQIMTNKARIESLFDKVKRSGIDDLKKYLRESDFYTAPASGKFHGAERGYLAQHSLNVYEEYWKICKEHDLPVSHENAIICGLLHDICKINLYIGEEKPYKWNSKVGTQGHARLSIKRAEQFIKLTPQEKRIIKYHMGMYATREARSPYSEYSLHELQDAFKNNDVKFFYIADEVCAQLKEK